MVYGHVYTKAVVFISYIQNVNLSQGYDCLNKK